MISSNQMIARGSTKWWCNTFKQYM